MELDEGASFGSAMILRGKKELGEQERENRVKKSPHQKKGSGKTNAHVGNRGWEAKKKKNLKKGPSEEGDGGNQRNQREKG